MTKPPPVILVDGSSYLFRAYHALPPLTNSRGEPTGAIVGVLNMLRKLHDEYRPSYIGVIFDGPGPTFRNDIYPEYKAHRPPAPEDLVAQIEPLYQIIRAQGLPLIVAEGVEADDLIGSLARRATAAGEAVLISTGDKDMAQLVGPGVTLINTMSDQLTDRQGVIDKFGVPPERIVDYLALVGDSVDNIPGIQGCGPKTAAKWLSEYGSLDELMARADEVKGKIGERLREGLGQLPMARELATIRTDCAPEIGLEQLQPQQPDPDSLRPLYERLESSRLLASLQDATPADPPPKAAATRKYETILTKPALQHWLKQLREAVLFSFDTETTGLDVLSAELVGLSFAVSAGEAAYIPVAHKYVGAPEQLERDWVLAQFKPLLEDPKRAKLGQNLKFDMGILARYDIALAGIAHDSMLESYVLDSTATRHDMDSLARHYLKLATTSYEDLTGKGSKQIGFAEVDIGQAAHYAAEDADVTLRLHQLLWPRLEKLPGLASLYREIEMPLVPVLSRMERTGVRIDSGMLAKQSRELGKRLEQLEGQAHELAGHPFNLGSPKQIGEIFFNELGMPVKEKTPKGQPSTSESVLQALADEGFELPRVILEHRGLAKLKSTYLDKLPEMVSTVTGRLHTSYHQAVAATGRLSSSDPNLQNIPIRTEEGRRIRRAFVADPDWIMLAADYSQIELRIMAHLSGDAGLLAAFAEGKDIHRATAAEVFGVSLDQVSGEQRRSAKAINFGLIYGMSAFGLARQLGIERKAAQEYVNLYFERYPGVQEFMERTRAEARELGYVETLFGRRLYLPDIKSRNGQLRAAAERTAINAPMQGTAADIIKRAMIAIDGWLQQETPSVRMLMQVHDELVFELKPSVRPQAEERIRELMQGAARLKVPLLVDVGVGDNWDAAH